MREVEHARWRRGALRAGLVILVAAVATVAGGVDVPFGSDLDRFTGEYRFVGGAEERDGIQAAIEEAVSSLNPLVRGIARGQIRQSLRPEQTVAVQVMEPGSVRIQLDGWRSPAMRTNGEVRSIRGPDGNPTRFSVNHQDQRLAIRSETAQGVRESWLSLSGDGAYLFMQVRVSSPQLPSAIRYTLSYRRVAGGALGLPSAEPPAYRFAAASDSPSGGAHPEGP